MVGTVAYMSPEQARGEVLDVRSDLFSLGAVLYEMATGRLAFGGDTTAIIFESILNRTPVAPVRLNPDVPPKLEEAINKLLEKDRRLRYQTAADLEADLRRLKRDSDTGRVAASASPPEGLFRSGGVDDHGRHHTPEKESGEDSDTGGCHRAAAVAAACSSGLPRDPLLTERDSILIADFVNTTGDPAFDGTLKQALAVSVGTIALSQHCPGRARSRHAAVHGSVAGRACNGFCGVGDLPARRHQGGSGRFDHRARDSTMFSAERPSAERASRSRGSSAKRTRRNRCWRNWAGRHRAFVPSLANRSRRFSSSIRLSSGRQPRRWRRFAHSQRVGV